MAIFADFQDAADYAAELTRFVLETVLVCRKAESFFVGTARQADLLFFEPSNVILTIESKSKVN